MSREPSTRRRLPRPLAGLVREPLAHFLVAGALLFGIYAWLHPGAARDTRRIVVTPDQIQILATTFERTWLRPPDREELRGLIDDFVTEEILYREALALGLAENDLVVRRRMRQKMEFLYEDLRDAPEPSEAELTRFVEEHASDFLEPERWNLRQLFVDGEKSGGDPRQRALRLLERVRAEAGTAAPELGDPTLLPRSLEAATEAEIARHFGEAFARAVTGMQEGTWVGPVASAFGLHVVHVSEHRPARMPALTEIRERAVREWEARQRERDAAELQRRLRERYEIEIQAPDPTDDPSLASRTP